VDNLQGELITNMKSFSLGSGLINISEPKRAEIINISEPGGVPVARLDPRINPCK